MTTNSEQSSTSLSQEEMSEVMGEFFRLMQSAVNRTLKAGVDPETVARLVLHFAYMTNGELADDYDLALKTATETLVASSTAVREFLDEQKQEASKPDQEALDAVPDGVTLH